MPGINNLNYSGEVFSIMQITSIKITIYLSVFHPGKTIARQINEIKPIINVKIYTLGSSGCELVLANLLFVSLLIMEDFPTLERPKRQPPDCYEQESLCCYRH